MIVRLTDDAETDLDAILAFIALDHPSRAISFVRELRAACAGLIPFPHRFPVLRTRGKSQVRRRVHGAYLICYRVRHEEVEVVRILHGRQDYEALLFPD